MALKVTALLVFGCLSSNSRSQELTVDELIWNSFTEKPTNITDNDSGTTLRFKSIPTTPAPVSNRSRSGVTIGGGYKSCGMDKECVPLHLCAYGNMVTTGENYINIRIDETACAYNEVCCNTPNKRSDSVIPPVPPVFHDGCGWRNKDGVGYRVTGDTDNESQFGEFPWMLAILRTSDVGGKIMPLYDCGGSLIAANVVLTASHCVINREANQLMVRGGEWDTQNTNEILGHVDKRVREIISHEEFNKGALCNDVALLILDDPFKWQENIRPICLPEPDSNFDYSRCFATGWGRDKFGREGKHQVILKKIDLPIVPRTTCQTNLRKTRLGLKFNLDDSFICAGGEKGKDACTGDDGSALVCPITEEPDRFYQAGIVAWGVGCGEENVPSVYANVPYLRQWISETLSSRGIQFTDFTP